VRVNLPEDPLKSDIAVEIKDDPKRGVHADLKVSAKGDLTIISGKDNVLQSIVNRLSTRRGELREIGHPEYGSDLEDVIGMPNTPDTLRIIETYVRDALKEERRIESILRVEAKFLEGRPDTVIVEMDIRLCTREIISVEVPVSLTGWAR
jgi:phage baseplate assembly protein W